MTLAGGGDQVDGRLTLWGRYPGGRREHPVSFDAMFYGADIQHDMILSYTWLARHGIMVHPRLHALVVGTMDPLLWIKGVGREAESPPGDHQAKETPLHMVVGVQSDRGGVRYTPQPPRTWTLPSRG